MGGQEERERKLRMVRKWHEVETERTSVYVRHLGTMWSDFVRTDILCPYNVDTSGAPLLNPNSGSSLAIISWYLFVRAAGHE